MERGSVALPQGLLGSEGFRCGARLQRVPCRQPPWFRPGSRRRRSRLSPKLRIMMSVALAVLALDLVTKSLVSVYVSPYAPIEVIPGFFQITHARNPGGALGLFRTLPPWVFVLLPAVCVLLINATAAFRFTLPKGTTPVFFSVATRAGHGGVRGARLTPVSVVLV